MKAIKTKKKSIGEENPCFVAAGIGEEYNNKFKEAKLLIDAASAAGCDAVRFESRSLLKENCQKLFNYCQKKDLTFYASVFNKEDSEWLADIGASIFKIPSPKMQDLSLIEYIAKRKKPIILSCGMSSEKEIDQTITAIYKTGNEKIILMHCIFAYPAKIEDLNLETISYYKKKFGLPAGFSDHSEGFEASCLAAALGADIIEKHLSIDNKDKPYCLTPKTINEWVLKIRKAEKAVGLTRA